MTHFAIHSPVTGVLFSGRYDSHLAAQLDAFDRFPGIAHLLDVVPVEDGGVDEEAVTDRALSMLKLWPGARFAFCDGCDKSVHHSDRTAHARSCQLLRRDAASSPERAP